MVVGLTAEKSNRRRVLAAPLDAVLTSAALEALGAAADEGRGVEPYGPTQPPRRRRGALLCGSREMGQLKTVPLDTPGLIRPQVGKGASLPHISLHDLRHGAASTLLANGVPVELIAMIPTRDIVEATCELLTRHRPTEATVSNP